MTCADEVLVDVALAELDHTGGRVSLSLDGIERIDRAIAELARSPVLPYALKKLIQLGGFLARRPGATRAAEEVRRLCDRAVPLLFALTERARIGASDHQGRARARLARFTGSASAPRAQPRRERTIELRELYPRKRIDPR